MNWQGYPTAAPPLKPNEIGTPSLLFFSDLEGSRSLVQIASSESLFP